MVDIFRASRISLNFAGASVRRGITRRRVLQLKARPFEIAACGGFVLTENTPDLADWLTPGLHVATFDSDSTLAAQVARYLRHVDDRDRIAAAGCAFVRERHTYQQRFEEVFAAMGLAGPKSAEA
jgi:spore maturation protein CgeB